MSSTERFLENGHVHVIAIRDINVGDRIEQDYNQPYIRSCLCSSCVNHKFTEGQEDERQRIHNNEIKLAQIDIQFHNQRFRQGLT